MARPRPSARLGGQVAKAPSLNRRDHGHEALAHGRQAIFYLGRYDAIVLARDEADMRERFSLRLRTRGAISMVPSAPLRSPVLTRYSTGVRP